MTRKFKVLVFLGMIATMLSALFVSYSFGKIKTTNLLVRTVYNLESDEELIEYFKSKILRPKYNVTCRQIFELNQVGFS